MLEAASFVSFSDPRVGSAGPTPGRRHDKGPAAGSCKFEKGESAGQTGGFDPRVSQKQPAGHGGLTRESESYLAGHDPTRPDATRRDATRDILKPP